ncbi:VacB/RNase II family 3'-5' exoribonuclease [Aestuariirhabdus sp. Z084]|uniref:VacB/RNase II family 3'-5' exoribonuclease n=1 Tax=Aestuariirhabdus haliotis TaxID=2918751 RepID=UPI00201B4167|nr:VacB/RNase II family 3'-5' exoribonuclease [Aestuariirhabdus haliotis]MCL6416428.1 VacB/RNase II family 3'-5' exoribonuclease [Aestuariirhabdus haliotis]MCL6420406.1 VacB/RNase II family 3'-5' exoribonuclease [Aestuariirhabdus haliotis]
MLDKSALQQLQQLKAEIHDSKETFDGVVIGSHGRFGFVQLDDGQRLFLPPEEMNRVFPGDRVRVSKEPSAKKQDNAVLEELLSSELEQFCGIYVIKGEAHFVQPDLSRFNRLLFVPPKDRGERQAGDLVRCSVKRHPFKNGKAQASILKCIGRPGDTGVEERFILEKYNYQPEWSAEVQQQQESITVEKLRELVAGRNDLSHTPFVTIDSASTQDMDDALWAEATQQGWNLWVAIADPDALIEAGSAIDQEAASRATSVYLPGFGIPMLPPALSRELCSLREAVDRPALLCRMQISPEGEILSHEFEQVAIRSHGKLSYDRVSAFFATGEYDSGTETALPEAVLESLRTLKAVTSALNQHREKHAVLFEDKPDYHLELDSDKRCVAIHRVDRSPAHQLVEEAMVAANRCAADFIAAAKVDGVFVSHAGIRTDRHESLANLLKQALPALADLDLSRPEAFKTLVNAARESDQPIRTLVSRMLERSLLVRRDAPHSGMGLARYMTFTSPIRKYNDLVVHRQIKAVLANTPAAELSDEMLQGWQEQHKRARGASNELEHWYMCLYMEQQMAAGKIDYDGTVVQVHSAGMTVRLNELGVEGQIDLRKRKVKYSFDPLLQVLEKGDERYQLGDTIAVTLQRCVLDECKVYFEPVVKEAAQATQAN